MRLTYHAEQQRTNRKITLDEIRETLRAPERARPSNSDDTCFIFTKHVDDRRIKVVFSFRDDDVTIVTVGDEPPRREARTIRVSSGVIACAALATRGERGVGRVLSFDGDRAASLADMAPDAGANPAASTTAVRAA